MRKDNIETTEVQVPSRRQFINKAGLVAGGAILGCLTLLESCSILGSMNKETSTESESPSYTLPTNASRIENLSEVTSAVQSEKEQLSLLTNDLTQFQLDMNELDKILAQLSRINDTIGNLSEDIKIKLQLYLDRRSKFIETLTQMMKKTSTTQDILVQNIK